MSLVLSFSKVKIGFLYLICSLEKAKQATNASEQFICIYVVWTALYIPVEIFAIFWQWKLCFHYMGKEMNVKSTRLYLLYSPNLVSGVKVTEYLSITTCFQLTKCKVIIELTRILEWKEKKKKSAQKAKKSIDLKITLTFESSSKR